MSIKESYLAVLGGVMAISPELYNSALDQMAKMTGRTNDAQFQLEVAEVGRSMPCDLD